MKKLLLQLVLAALMSPAALPVSAGDTVLYRDLQEELIRILEKIIVERCGISASLSLEFVEKENNRHREDKYVRYFQQQTDPGRDSAPFRGLRGYRSRDRNQRSFRQPREGN